MGHSQSGVCALIENLECSPWRVDYVNLATESDDYLYAEEFVDFIVMHYDYIAIIDVDTEFIGNYNMLFETQPSDISLYKVDGQNRILKYEGSN